MRTLYFYGGLLGLSLASLLVFTFTMGAGRLTSPGLMLSISVLLLGVVARLVYRAAAALLPEAGIQEEEAQAAVGRRRKELEREYQNLKRALKELELDHAMRKLSERDYGEIRTRYRERAVRILRQLDQGHDYRRQIEADLEARRQARGEAPKLKEPLREPSKEVPPERPRAVELSASAICATCATGNDADASFCKRCGTPIQHTAAQPATQAS